MVSLRCLLRRPVSLFQVVAFYGMFVLMMACDGFVPQARHNHNDEDAVSEGESLDFTPEPGLYMRGAYISIAWPLGSSENPADWYGDDGDRSSGGNIKCACGTINSHSGAEYYARDLNRNDKLDMGKKLYAGISGRVVVAKEQSGYGYTVVIYDESRHVALRYAHMQSSLAVRYGQQVSARQFIGYLGDSGNAKGIPHVHLVAFENLDHFYSNGDPVIPTLCDSDFYSLAIYFYC